MIAANEKWFIHSRVFKDYLGQGSASLFCKRPDSKYFRICGPNGLYSKNVAIESRKINELECDQEKLYLKTQRQI